MLITDIKKIGNSNKYRIFADDVFFATLLDEDIVKNHLKTDLEIDEEKLREICFVGQKNVAFDNCLKLLGTYPKTEKELRRYLKEKGYTIEVIDYVCQKLIEYKFLNDDSYADMYIKANIKKKGKRLIAFELKQKGIDEKIVWQKLESVEDDSCFLIAEKYMRNKVKDEKNKQKAYRFLASKGFESDKIIEALNTIFKGEDF